MKPRDIYKELNNLNRGALSDAISAEDDYAKITIYASLLVHKNIQFSKVYLGDKVLGTFNKYRYQKISNDSELSGEDSVEVNEDLSNLFSSMLNAYLTKVKVNPNLIKVLIIFLVSNNLISEFRNVRKLSDSEWGIKTLEYIDNLGVNSKVLMDSFLSHYDGYPIHREIIEDYVKELMFCNNCRERYYTLMKVAWNQGELSINDSIEQDLFNNVLDLRNKVRDMTTRVDVKDLCELLEIGGSTYRNKKNALKSDLSNYFYNSVYSNLIDYIISLQ